MSFKFFCARRHPNKNNIVLPFSLLSSLYNLSGAYLWLRAPLLQFHTPKRWGVWIFTWTDVLTNDAWAIQPLLTNLNSTVQPSRRDVIALTRGQWSFSTKGQMVIILGFVDHTVSVTHSTLLLQLESSYRQYINNEHGCVLIKLYLWVQKCEFHVFTCHKKTIFFFWCFHRHLKI